jgi:hypothetical protein
MHTEHLPNERLSQRLELLIAGFLISLHGAVARRFAMAMTPVMANPGDIALHVEVAKEYEIVGLLTHMLGWRLFGLDPFLVAKWELAWLPAGGLGASQKSIFLDTAALGHAAHAAIRPTTALPEKIVATDPFAMALRQIEFSSGLMLQTQVAILKAEGLRTGKDAVEEIVSRRHAQVKELWTDVLKLGAARTP